MDGKDRGVIIHRDRSRQINDFRNMRYCRGITPTDIDGAFEFDSLMFIFFELKYGEKLLDYGQRLFIERVVNVINGSGKMALAIHGSHDVADWNQDVLVDKCRVVSYYSFSKKWIPAFDMTIKQLTDSFIYQYGKKEWLSK